MRQTKRIITTLLLGFIIALGSYITADAAGVTQTAQTQDSITVNFDGSLYSSQTLTGWTAVLQQYIDGNKVDLQSSAQLGADVKEYTFTGLAAGTEYRVTVNYTYKNSSGKENSTSTSSKPIYTTPGKVTGLKQAKWWYYIESVDFSWDAQSACKYEWVAYQGKKQVANNTYASSSSTGSFKVKNNKIYTVKVRAYEDINGQTVYGDWSDTAYLFTQPMVSKNGVTIDGSGRMKVKWGKISGVTGYEVYVSTKEKTGYKKVASVKSSKGSATIKKLKKKKFSKKKTYYVYIVAKKKVDGVTYTSGRHYSMQYKKGSNILRWSFD